MGKDIVLGSSRHLAFGKSNGFFCGRIYATTKVASWPVLALGRLMQPCCYLATMLGLRALQLTPTTSLGYETTQPKVAFPRPRDGKPDGARLVAGC
jgi:hypothetical protein